jgi:hypothetical protein
MNGKEHAKKEIEKPKHLQLKIPVAQVILQPLIIIPPNLPTLFWCKQLETNSYHNKPLRLNRHE